MEKGYAGVGIDDIAGACGIVHSRKQIDEWKYQTKEKKMSVKYTIIKAAFRILPVQKMMAKPYEELLKMFKTAEAKPEIPRL